MARPNARATRTRGGARFTIPRPVYNAVKGAIQWTDGMARAIWPYLRLPLTVLAVVHLVLILVFPAGSNRLFGVERLPWASYLTLFQVSDTLGFQTVRGEDRFIVFRIFTQDGQQVQDTFPDPAIAPKLRYDRWAVAGSRLAAHHPVLHTELLHFFLERIPSPPVRLEMYGARYKWDRNTLDFPWPGNLTEPKVRLELLGTYNGFTRTWATPQVKEENQ